MRKWMEIPAPLHRKLFLTVCLGGFCILIGTGVFWFNKDRVILVLSAVVFLLCMAKALSLYKMIQEKRYEIVEGICIGIIPKPMRRYRKIRILDKEGAESTLLLDKHAKIKIGNRYRFYFKATQRISLGSDYLDTALSSDCFIGYENLGEESQFPPDLDDQKG